MHVGGVDIYAELVALEFASLSDEVQIPVRVSCIIEHEQRLGLMEYLLELQGKKL